MPKRYLFVGPQGKAYVMSIPGRSRGRFFAVYAVIWTLIVSCAISLILIWAMIPQAGWNKDGSCKGSSKSTTSIAPEPVISSLQKNQSPIANSQWRLTGTHMTLGDNQSGSKDGHVSLESSQSGVGRTNLAVEFQKCSNFWRYLVYALLLFELALFGLFYCLVRLGLYEVKHGNDPKALSYEDIEKLNRTETGRTEMAEREYEKCGDEGLLLPRSYMDRFADNFQDTGRIN